MSEILITKKHRLSAKKARAAAELVAQRVTTPGEALAAVKTA